MTFLVKIAEMKRFAILSFVFLDVRIANLQYMEKCGQIMCKKCGVSILKQNNNRFRIVFDDFLSSIKIMHKAF